MPHPDRRGQILQAGDDAGEPVGFGRIVRGPQLEHHLVLRSQLQLLKMASGVQIPHVQRVAVLAAEQQIGVDAVLDHRRRAPLAGDHRVLSEVPPEVVGEVLGSAVAFPSAFDLERLRVEDENPARTVAVGVAKGVDIDAVGTAMGRVRPAVAGLADDLGGVDDLDEPRAPGVGLRIEDVDAGRAHARHDQVAALHVRMRGIRAQTGAARVPPEMVQLVAGAWHDDAFDRRAITGRLGIQIEHGHRVGGLRIRVEQGDVGQCLPSGLHGHRGRRIEALVGQKLRHRGFLPGSQGPRGPIRRAATIGS